MRPALLFLLVACGKPASDAVPEPKPAADAPAAISCKAGTTTCDVDDVMMCEDGGKRRKISSCRGGCKAGACVETCSANDVELIYVVDGKTNSLLSFDPRKLPADPFKKIGPLSCGGNSTPNSMAVDRTGIAWIGYDNGFLYRSSLFDAHCLSQASRVDGGPTKFGMGFVSDGPKLNTEKLFVVNFQGRGESGGIELATIDTNVFPTRWNKIGKLSADRYYSPELTGTAEGKLYGYFPGQGDRGFVQEIDRGGKLLGKPWNLPAGEGEIGAWAFAFWGDVFYVFVTVDDVDEVHAIHRKTGKHEVAVKNTSYRVVGAGVSTCAPLLEKPL